MGILGNAAWATSSPGVPSGTDAPWTPRPPSMRESNTEIGVPREGPCVPPRYTGVRGFS